MIYAIFTIAVVVWLLAHKPAAEKQQVYVIRETYIETRDGVAVQREIEWRE